jgi:hypothetical protein
MALLLSQCGIAAGAVKTKLFGWAAPALSIPALRWAMLGAALLFEMGIGAAAAPYVFTHDGRAQAAQSFRATWHVCEVFLGAGR